MQNEFHKVNEQFREVNEKYQIQMEELELLKDQLVEAQEHNQHLTQTVSVYTPPYI